MIPDILAALSEETAPVGAKVCRIQRWLNDIPDETPGKADLEATLTVFDSAHPHYRTLDALDRLLVRLGLTTSIKSIGDHRRQRCRCFT